MIDIDVIRERHRPLTNPAGVPVECNWCEQDWPCDTRVVLDALDAMTADLDALLCNGPEERVWLGYKQERDAARADAERLAEALLRTYDVMSRLGAQAADGGGVRRQIYVTVEAWREGIDPVIHAANEAIRLHEETTR